MSSTGPGKVSTHLRAGESVHVVAQDGVPIVFWMKCRYARPDSRAASGLLESASTPLGGLRQVAWAPRSTRSAADSRRTSLNPRRGAGRAAGDAGRDAPHRAQGAASRRRGRLPPAAPPALRMDRPLLRAGRITVAPTRVGDRTCAPKCTHRRLPCSSVLLLWSAWQALIAVISKKSADLCCCRDAFGLE